MKLSHALFLMLVAVSVASDVCASTQAAVASDDASASAAAPQPLHTEKLMEFEILIQNVGSTLDQLQQGIMQQRFALAKQAKSRFPQLPHGSLRENVALEIGERISK